MIGKLSGIYSKLPRIMKYLLLSMLSTFLDTSIVWILLKWCNIDIVVSNTAGVIAGFILHYFLSSRTVFDTKYGLVGFTVYFGTFLFGLIIADIIIYQGYDRMIPLAGESLAFLLSKGISIVIPFFIMYYSRLFLYNLLKNRRL